MGYIKVEELVGYLSRAEAANCKVIKARTKDSRVINT